MPQESQQKKLGRVRPPRVHITYDVETGGAIEKRELPFVVGVLADLSGQPENPPLPMKDETREFVDIDRDNFDTVMAKIEPRLAFKADNRLSEDDTKLGVELKFKCLDDFSPTRVAEQVPVLRKLLEARRALANLRASLIGNDKLEALLADVLADTEKLQRIGSEEGIKAETGKES